MASAAARSSLSPSRFWLRSLNNNPVVVAPVNPSSTAA